MGMHGLKHTNETKRKISEAFKIKRELKEMSNNDSR